MLSSTSGACMVAWRMSVAGRESDCWIVAGMGRGVNFERPLLCKADVFAITCAHEPGGPLARGILIALVMDWRMSGVVERAAWCRREELGRRVAVSQSCEFSWPPWSAGVAWCERQVGGHGRRVIGWACGVVRSSGAELRRVPG